MKIRTKIKAGALVDNHNEKMKSHKSKGLVVKSSVKAGALADNHNEKMKSDARIR